MTSTTSPDLQIKHFYIKHLPNKRDFQTCSSSTMAVQSRIAAVTGANKGIGFAIGSTPLSLPILPIFTRLLRTNPPPNQSRNLALQYPSSPLRSGPFLIYLTARSAERGRRSSQEAEQRPRAESRQGPGSGWRGHDDRLPSARYQRRGEHSCVPGLSERRASRWY